MLNGTDPEELYEPAARALAVRAHYPDDTSLEQKALWEAAMTRDFLERMRRED